MTVLKKMLIVGIFGIIQISSVVFAPYIYEEKSVWYLQMRIAIFFSSEIKWEEHRPAKWLQWSKRRKYVDQAAANRNCKCSDSENNVGIF